METKHSSTFETSHDSCEDEYHAEASSLTHDGRGASRRLLGAAVVGLAAAALVFEQSPLNESVRIPPAADVFRQTGSELKTAGAVGALTFGIEAPTSVIVAAGLHYERERIKRIIDKFQKPQETQPKEPVVQHQGLKETITDTGFAFGLGPSILVAKKHIQDPDRSMQDNVKTGLKASAAVSVLAASIGGVSAVLLKQADNLGMFKKPAEYFVDYAADWKFWIGVVGGIQLAAYIKNRFSSSDKTNTSENMRN